MKLTRNSFYFLIITLLVLMAGFNTRANLLFFLAYILIGIFVISLIFSGRNLRGLKVTRKSEKVAFQNQVIDTEVQVNSTNAGFFLLLKDKFNPANPENQEKNFFCYHITPDNPLTFHFKEKAHSRGKFLLGPTQVISLYPFLLFSRKVNLDNYTNILIYPEIFKIKNFPSYDQILTRSTNKIITTAGGSNEFFGIREYQSGDSIRIIDWKVSARLNQLVVKEFEKQLGYASYLILDIGDDNIYGSGIDSNFEKSINIAASIIKNRLDNNDNIGLIYGSKYIIPGTGQEQLYTILNELALLKPDKGEGLKEAFQEADRIVEPESVVIILCKQWRQEYAYYLNLFNTKKFKIIFVYLVPESYTGKVSRDNLTEEVSRQFFQISVTGVKLYPYYYGELVSEIFNQDGNK